MYSPELMARCVWPMLRCRPEAAIGGHLGKEHQLGLLYLLVGVNLGISIFKQISDQTYHCIGGPFPTGWLCRPQHLDGGFRERRCVGSCTS